jgi:hypothetical protein
MEARRAPAGRACVEFRVMPRRLVVLALLVLVPLTASATVVMAMSMEEMAARVPLIVRGTVHRTDTQWGEGRARIWTYGEVVVTETLKGAGRATVVVRQPGGVIGDIGERVAGTATLTPGEEVVLFLEPVTDEPNVFIPFALAASKVSLENRRGVKVAVRDLSGITFARKGQRSVIHPVDEREVLGTAEAFLARVRQAVKGGAR